jgi:SAM-dependent methyltransferase
MNETTKARPRRVAEGFYDRFLRGKGLDIGCGLDKVVPEAVGYDIENGDAQQLADIENETFDYVYSSHCLEHMRDPLVALLNWWRVVKPGGHLIVAVPDEDLYEQGIVPSCFNPDHKVTFTISKERSWSPVSRNLIDLLRHLPRHKVISLRIIDTGYDYEKLGSDEDQTLGTAEAGIEAVIEKVKEELPLRTSLHHLASCPRCERLELTLLGQERDGSLQVLCRSCGTRRRIRTTAPEPGNGATTVVTGGEKP